MSILAIIGSSPMAYRLGKNAHEMGVKTIVFSNVWHDYLEGYIDEFVNISVFEIEKITDICKERGVNGVIATTELTVNIAAQIADRLSTPGIPKDMACSITDKLRNREKCTNLKYLHQPVSMGIYSIDELKNALLNYPLIVKPTSKGGKRGVTVVRTSKDLEQAFNYALKFSDSSPVLIEEFIEGDCEYSVESLSYKGIHYIIQVTQKISSGAPHCVELGHLQPANLSSRMRGLVEVAVKEGLSAIGLDNSPCHTEIKIKDEKVYLIEFNPRFGGDLISYPLVDLSTGYPYMKGAIKIALDKFEPVDFSSFKNHFSGVYFITEQTKLLKPLFDVCEQYNWLYEKHFVSDKLVLLENNNSTGTNYMIYHTTDKPLDVDSLLGQIG